jgi:hypothetical protein
MDYGRVLGDALRLTWRHRFLWVFGLFAAGTSGTCTPSVQLPIDFGRGSFDGPARLDPQVARAIESVAAWVAVNLWVVAVAAGLAVVVALALLVVSLISKGALIGSLVRLSRGEPASLRGGWLQGTRLFWRYAGLWLLSVALIGVVAVTAGVAVLLLIGLASLGEEPTVVAVLLGAFLGFLALVVGVPLFIAASVVLTYAERFVVEGRGVIAAIGEGIGLLRRRFGASALLWLISVGVSIGGGLLLSVVGLALVLPLGVLVAGAFVLSGLSPLTLVLGVVAVIALVAVLWVLSAVVNTYMAAYWTLGYLGLTDRYPPPSAATADGTSAPSETSL